MITRQRVKWNTLENDYLNRDPEERKSKLKKYGSYNAELVGVPDVWRDNNTGKFLILDGAGRQFMAIRDGHGEDEIEVLVHEGLTREEAKILGTKLNMQRSPYTTVDLFLKEYKDGSATEVAIMNIVETHGFAVKTKVKPGVIAAPKVLYYAYNLGLLDDVLTIAAKALGVFGEANDSNILSGITELLIMNNDKRIDYDRLCTRLGNAGSAKIFVLRAKEKYKAKFGKDGRRVAEAIIDLYNDGISKVPGYSELRRMGKRDKPAFNSQ